MQNLKALQLVEGVSEPKGGYKTTAEAYNTLDIEEMDEPASIPLSHNGDPIDDQVIQEINLMSVHHPEKCRAELRMQSSVRDFQEGEFITVGPTPKSGLAITGTIDGIVGSDSKLIIRTETMEAPVNRVIGLEPRSLCLSLQPSIHPQSFATRHQLLSPSVTSIVEAIF